MMRKRNPPQAKYVFSILGLLFGFITAIAGSRWLIQIQRKKGIKHKPITQTEDAGQGRPAAQPASQQTQGPESSLLNISNLGGIVVPLFITAIFYFSGWIYEMHWYSFFNLDASRFDFSTAQITVQGTPGILLFIVGLLISTSAFAVYKSFVQSSSISIADTPQIIIVSYLVLTAVVFLASLLLLQGYIPFEVRISAIVVLALVAFFYFFLPVKINISDFSFTLAVENSRIFELSLTSAAFSQVFWDFIRKKQYTDAIRLMPALMVKFAGFYVPFLSGFSNRFKLPPALQDRVTQEREKILNSWSEKRQVFFRTIQATWRVWIGILLLMLFLVSVSISSVLGEYDARRGARFLSGNWQIPETYLYSDQAIPSIPKYLNYTPASSFVYGPFGLIARDSARLYLIDWQPGSFYTRNSRVYIVPVTDQQVIEVFVPTPTPVPTLTPTPAPTSTPKPTETPTPIN